ncbi:hypothetical protein [Anabaena azotica]|uniref:Uncharacterized protein n=1 Tax=Anabaena azotica FACHB-119 TaxID=947527 RepID=A0ABR8D1A2_9NOST|nr:hypothetical protein [Anabaena azotica]MBD2500107.1 hypothetical protein [Anabaena azotica FACHB-119]
MEKLHPVTISLGLAIKSWLLAAIIVWQFYTLGIWQKSHGTNSAGN